MARISHTLPYTRLAYEAAEHFIAQRELLSYSDLFRMVPQLTRQSACYVSVFQMPGRRQRGVLGQVLPTQPTLAHEIVWQTVAVLSGALDGRLTRHDLRYTQFAVSVLGPLQRVLDPAHLNPERYGLFVSHQGLSSTVLPQRAGILSAEDQLATALREAGVTGASDSVSLYRFDVSHFDA